MGSLSNNDVDGNKNGKKAIGLYQQSNNFARASCFFVHFFAVVASLRLELVNTAQEFSLISDSTPDNFAKIFQIKWNWIRSMKFETVQIHFLSDVFRFVVIQKFCYHGNVT